jgi:hypothetical protein
MAKILTMDSDAWCAFTGITVLDPDGWNRKNLSESWAEEITEEEFNLRVMQSTIIPAKR